VNIYKEKLGFKYGELINHQHDIKIQVPTAPWTQHQAQKLFRA